jgi:hypothetical protein
MDPGLLRALAERGCYPHQPEDVQVLQTHISVVCLAGDLVYKLKKPVRLPFVDFSTVARRRYWCEQELVLNRRLCPQIYLDVVPLFRTTPGWSFVGPGEVVDHAVRMRRLPEARMLDRLLPGGGVDARAIAALARQVADFHRRDQRSPATLRHGHPDHLLGFWADNFRETQALVPAVFDAALHGALAAHARQDGERLRPVLLRRWRHGFVVDGHGDLHARNICMTDPPAIYDCLEFAPRLRCLDVAVENAFLVMDLRYRGRQDLARVYLDAYIAETGDSEQRALLPPLVCYRALVRSKVAALAALDADLPPADRDGAKASAQRHFVLAGAAALDDDGPLLLAAIGLPASGKSHVFARLAADCGLPLLQSDRVRKELAGLPAATRGGGELYAPAVVERVYDELIARGLRAARDARSVALVDATFVDPRRREQLEKAASRAGVRWLWCWFDVDDATARARLARRRDDPGAISDAGLEVYERMRERFVSPAAGAQLVRVDGGAPAAASCGAILAAAVNAASARSRPAR